MQITVKYYWGSVLGTSELCGKTLLISSLDSVLPYPTFPDLEDPPVHVFLPSCWSVTTL